MSSVAIHKSHTNLVASDHFKSSNQVQYKINPFQDYIQDHSFLIREQGQNQSSIYQETYWLFPISQFILKYVKPGQAKAIHAK